MITSHRIYELLLDYANTAEPIEEIIIGLVWTLCRGWNIGLAMSPGVATRTLSWSGTLRGKPMCEVAEWVRDWDTHRSVVGLSVINAAINARSALPESTPLAPESGCANLAVFEHFLPQLNNRKVVVIGHYPGNERHCKQLRLSVLERNPGTGDLPDPAAEYLIPDADWVFITASAIANKTLPRLAELAEDATTVLMGPTVPWLQELHTFGIDYLAGVEIMDPAALVQVVQEGGGLRIFDAAVHYRVASLSADNPAEWLKRSIAQAFRENEALTVAMTRWYRDGDAERFPQFESLEAATHRLSLLDTQFKELWDQQNGPDSKVWRGHSDSDGRASSEGLLACFI